MCEARPWLNQTVTRGEETLVTAEVMVVGVRDGRPARLAADVRERAHGGDCAGPEQTGQDRCRSNRPLTLTSP